MDSALPYLIGLIAVALAFDFLNGLHDAANSIATIVSTRVLPPQYAVFWAAFFNFVAFLFFGLNVAQTVGTGIITPDIIDDRVIFGALMGAISWNLLTWALGIPSSSSHALIGGLVGAGIAKAGIGTVVWSGLIKTGSAVVFSPALGFVLALFLVLAVSWIFVRRTPLVVDNIFRSLQFVSASFYSLGHGSNDAQKTMGIIAVLLFSHGKLGGEFHVPFWEPRQTSPAARYFPRSSAEYQPKLGSHSRSESDLHRGRVFRGIWRYALDGVQPNRWASGARQRPSASSQSRRGSCRTRQACRISRRAFDGIETSLISNSVSAQDQPGRHGLSVQTQSFHALDRHEISEAAGLDRRDFALLQLVGDLIAQGLG
jgi:hypothetical protein